MTHLHYHRWITNFTLENFSSENSMRDYLFNNPNLFFGDDVLVVPISQESHLYDSNLETKKAGRVDIFLCEFSKKAREKISSNNHNKQNKIIIDKSEIYVWIAELKNVEASYLNGLEQLLDYISVFRDNLELQAFIERRIENYFDGKGIKVKLISENTDDGKFDVCGALVAPSFDFVSEIRLDQIRSSDSWQLLKNIKDNLKTLAKSKSGFTLSDIVLAAQKELGIENLSLQKLIRFLRGDEVIIYTENALGQAAAAQARRDVDPMEIVMKIPEEDNDFYFIDKDRAYKEVKCRLANKRGRSNSFIVELLRVGDEREINILSDKDKQWKFEPKSLASPIELSTRKCSMSLYKHFYPEKYANDQDLFKDYNLFGDWNFVRKKDGKRLNELRQELKNTN